MIIDSHAHIDWAEGLGWLDPPEALLPLMDRAGIGRAVVMTYRDATGPNDPATLYVRDAVARYPTRLIGYVRINPYASGAEAALDQAMVEFGFKGLKLHPVSYVGCPYDPATLSLMRRAARFSAPVLFHCGDEPFALPQELGEAARRCPEVTVILAHMGGYFHTQAAIDVARTLPNVLLDTSAMPYPEMIRRAVDTLGPERVLFASDGPGCLPSLEVDKVKQLRFPREIEAQILAGNIERVLKGVRHAV